jgi:hypothetical protein
MALSASSDVATMPRAVFHDPFLSLPENGGDRDHERLANPVGTADDLARFTHAMFGWVAYMPLFLKISRRISPSALLAELVQREAIIREAAAALEDVLEVPEFAGLGDQFRAYCSRVDRDYDDWRLADIAWRQYVRPHLFTVQQADSIGT